MVAKILAKLKKIINVNFILLFLEGFHKHNLEMSGKKQQNTDMIEIRLKQAFTEYAFAAYMLLARERWTDDFIYIYANGIRRLIGLVWERKQTCV